MVLVNNKSYLLQAALQFVVLIVLTVIDIRNFKKGKKLLPVGILMLAYGVFWVRYGINWAFAANFILWALYTISRRSLLIDINTENVVYPSFPKKKIQWAELNNVILKDDVLTIDCKNNKIYQHYIQNSEKTADEQEFNGFCRKQFMK